MQAEMDKGSRKNQRAGLAPWKWLLLPLMASVILMAYLWAGAGRGFQDPESARIIFWHVPMAILSMVWFWVAAFYSGRYLWKGQEFDDVRASRAAEVGLLLTILATVTGAIFSKMQWAGGFNTPWYVGYWQWDPQQTAIVVVILFFMAYFGLRMSVEDERLRARLSAVYALVGGVAVPFCYYVLPKLPIFDPSIHPTNEVLRGKMSLDYRVTFWLSTLGFLGITLWAYQLKVRLARLEWARTQAAGPDDEGRVEAVRAAGPDRPDWALGREQPEAVRKMTAEG